MNLQIKEFKISLTSGDDIFLKGQMDLIDVVEWLTKEKTTTISYMYEEEKQTTIFRKHIVKVQEVK